jgi:GTP-binding protein
MSARWKASVENTAFKKDQFPSQSYAEIAVAGRSNVGKSTLINALLGARLAHVGGTPGKTRSINFFLVEREPEPFRLVDLPGYGYASRSKDERNKWARLIESYVSGRRSLSLVLHLVDFRHGLLENDASLQEWLFDRGLPVFVVFTKGDKIAKSKHKAFRDQFIRDGLKSLDVPLVTSAEKGTGIEELRNFIEMHLAGMPENALPADGGSRILPAGK